MIVFINFLSCVSLIVLLQTTDLLYWDRYAVRYTTRKCRFSLSSVIVDDRKPHLLWRKYAFVSLPMVRLTALRVTLITRMRLLFISANAKSISRAAWLDLYHHSVIERLSVLCIFWILHSRKRASIAEAAFHELTGYKVVGACPVYGAKWLRLTSNPKWKWARSERLYSSKLKPQIVGNVWIFIVAV